jgi:hypothetical protein
MISNESSHWSTSEVMSQVWQPQKIVSPVKTMRSCDMSWLRDTAIAAWPQNFLLVRPR